MTLQSLRGREAALIATISIALATATVAPAQEGFKTLVSFAGANGAYPYAGLLQGVDGNLYGTTYEAGANGNAICYGPGCGTIFKITPAGVLTTVYSFCAQTNCTDGYQPDAGLVQDTSGNFYGTTSLGGLYNFGTVFRITPKGSLATLYNFCSRTPCTDGGFPTDALVWATDGNFYGTTVVGGAAGYGTVFRITPTGTLTTLYSFCTQNIFCPDGIEPYAGLAQGTDGNFYGTTYEGGAYSHGTVFKVSPTGTLTTLYSFCGPTCGDGEFPYTGLVQAADGNFYGTTPGGGPSDSGTVFKITSTGTLTTLYSFCGQPNCADGEGPAAGLVQGTDGNLYGTTEHGGAKNRGTVFKITFGGTLTVLHSFDGKDGQLPGAAPDEATNGDFYGTVDDGGRSTSCTYQYGCGTVFALNMGFGPFVVTLPTSGKVGAEIGVLGTDLKGATSVTFNGTSATFKVVSPSLITTTVPLGATTGTVQVVTPGATLSSNLPFQVLP